jgi:hypothetical protein
MKKIAQIVTKLIFLHINKKIAEKVPLPKSWENN